MELDLKDKEGKANLTMTFPQHRSISRLSLNTCVQQPSSCHLKKIAVMSLMAFTLLVTFTSVEGARLRDEFLSTEEDAINDFALDILSCFDLPGVSIGVVRGRATFATNHGLADWETAQPMKSDTLFNLGSTAKALVPYILAEIMNGEGNQDGRIRWNTSIKELLKSEMGLETDAIWADQTLRDALVYSASGTPASGPFPSSSAADMSTMAGLPQNITRQDIIRRAIQFMPDFPEFETSGHYSNIMYTIVAHLAEKMTGKSWEQLVQEEVLDKNGMTDTYFSPAAMSKPNVAKPHFYSQELDMYISQDKSLFNLQPFEPIGSIMATSSDVAMWLRHLLHNLQVKGSDSGINMLIGDAFAHSVTARNIHNLYFQNLTHETESTLGFGMGWEVSQYRGRKRYMYTGHLYAYTSHIWLFPDSHSAVYVVVNGHTSSSKNAAENYVTISLALRGILYQISDILHHETPWVTSKDVCAIAGFEESEEAYADDDLYDTLMDEPMEAESELVQYPLPLDVYKGSYAHGLIGDLVIDSDKSGLLTVTLGLNLRGELRPKAGASTRLLLKAVGTLKNTHEWLEEKVVEFLPATVSTAGGGDKFQVVRLYLTDKLYYDFQRGKVFSTMLVQAEEEKIRKAKEEEERKIKEEKEAQMRKEAAIKAREEAEKRRLEEIEKKKMMAAVAREKAAEEARKEAERKAMLEAVAREKAEEKAEEAGKEEKVRGETQAQAAALEKTNNVDAYEEVHTKANLVKKDNLSDHQSHQPYSENDNRDNDNTKFEVLPPSKVKDDDNGKKNSADVNDKDGVSAGPVASVGLLFAAAWVVSIQALIFRY